MTEPLLSYGDMRCENCAEWNDGVCEPELYDSASLYDYEVDSYEYNLMDDFAEYHADHICHRPNDWKVK